MAAGLWLAAIPLGGCDDGRSVDPPGDSGPPPAPVRSGHLELIAEADAVHTVEVDVDCGPGFEHTYAIETRVRGVAGELGDRIVPAPLGMCRVQARLAEPGWQCASEPVDVEVVEGLTGVWLTLLCRAPDDGAINVTVEVIELNRFGVPRFEPDKLIRQCGFTEVTPFATAPDLPPACALDGATTVLAAAGVPTAGPSGCRLDVEPMDLSSLVADPATVLTAVICRDAPADAAPLPVDLYLGRDPELVRATVPVAPGCAPYPLAGAEFEAAPEANGEWDPRAVEEAFLVLQPGRHEGPATIRLLALRQRCCPGSINGCGECGDEPVELCNDADDDCDLRVDEAFPALGEGCAAGEGACRADGALICAEDGRAVVCDAEPVPPEAVQPEVGDPEACNHYDGTDEQRDDCLRADQLCQGEYLASWCSRRASGVGDRDNRYYRWGLRQARAR